MLHLGGGSGSSCSCWGRVGGLNVEGHVLESLGDGGTFRSGDKFAARRSAGDWIRDWGRHLVKAPLLVQSLREA